jgi:hypothetical protein
MHNDLLRGTGEVGVCVFGDIVDYIINNCIPMDIDLLRDMFSLFSQANLSSDKFNVGGESSPDASIFFSGDLPCRDRFLLDKPGELVLLEDLSEDIERGVIRIITFDGAETVDSGLDNS